MDREVVGRRVELAELDAFLVRAGDGLAAYVLTGRPTTRTTPA